MRLTLRTMLAYLDDILEPDDSADIGRKIEESEFASSLVHRTRDCMRRVRLRAPPPLARGMALDANTVAEYLDNTLAAERVPDFEKICLESDMHLAEVASCHQILTLVLGEPADVDAESRERMYHIAAEAEVAAPPVAAASATAGQPPIVRTPDVRVAGGRRHRPEVPEYLREPRRRLWPVAAVLCLVAILTFVVLLVAGPAQMRAQLLALLRRPATESPAGAPAEEPNAGEPSRAQPDAGSPPVGEAPREASPPNNIAAPERTGANEPNANGGAARDGSASPHAGVRPPGTEPARTARLPAGGAPASVLPTPPAVGDGGGRPAPGVGNPPGTAPERNVPATIAPATSPPPTPPVPDTGPVAPGPEAGAVPPLPGTGSVAPGTAAPAPGTALAPGGAAQAPPVQEIGRYISDEDVLLAFQKSGRQWRRVPRRATLGAGELLLTIPLFHPKVHLTTGIVVEQVGPTLIKLEAPDAQGVPGVAIDYGQLLLLTVGKADNKVRLYFGERQGVLSFADGDSAAALEVRRVPVPGTDPEMARAMEVELFATSGKLVWEESGAAKKLTGPARLALTPTAGPRPAANEMPAWITSSSRNKLDENAATTIEHELVADRPIPLTLKELVDHRQVEVRSLAIRSCVQVGLYEPAIAALSDETQRSERTGWPAYIESLRTAIARSGEMAADVRAAFEKKHEPAEGRQLYRMLWGYTQDNLKDGEAAVLVKNLNSDKLEFQVLSAWNLHRITGIAFRPEISAAKRKPHVQRWLDRLRDGKIGPAAEAPRRSPAKGDAARKT